MRRLHTILMAAGLVACLAPALPAVASGVPGLCAPDEVVLASCRTGQKTAALCGSRDLGPEAGHAQYRYGRPGALDLVFPEPAVHPRQFVRQGSVMFAGGGEGYLRVVNGDHEYVFYDGMGRGWAQRGLRVLRGGQPLANLACRGPDGDTYQRLPPGTLPVADREDEQRWYDQRPDPGGG